MKKKTNDEYRVPSLAEADSAYADLIAKRMGLEQRYSELNTQRSKLLGEIAAAKAAGGKYIAPAVAELLGGPKEGTSVAELSRQLREVATEMAHIEDAREVLFRRTAEARDVASKTVCVTVRQEYQRRLTAVCEAARALEAAREEHDALLDDLEREDVRVGYLGPVRPFFLGDRGQGQVFHFLKEVREAGHNV
ncbi:NACalpha-BTF3-like transcription factor [Bradyrhizobium sp. CIR18]|nr:NACalpha-BTF3-like transcription factor [Bradyrhizobium sp. CIR18]